MNWFVYIAEDATHRYYTGITTSPSERILKHNEGKGSRRGIQQGPFEIRYVSRSFSSKSDARKREAQIKRWSRTKKQKLISGEWK